ncbi:MAG: hypothetical protein QM786_19180 [Breznakibacter sp.]
MIKKLLFPGFVAAIAIFIATMLVGYLFDFMSPSLGEVYANEAIFRPWNDPLMYLYFLVPLLLGYVLAWLWTWTYPVVPGSRLSKTFRFALAYWLVASLPGMLLTFSSFKLPLVMIASWTVTAFFQGWVAAVVYTWMVKVPER